MQNIEIKKVKVIKKGEKIEVGYKEKCGDLSAYTDRTGDYPPHKHLMTAMDGLRVHLAIMADYILEADFHNEEEIKKFNVTGYSIGGNEDEPGLVITGTRITGRGKAVNMNTPFQKLDVDAEQYEHIEDLKNKIKDIVKEVNAYLFDGKQGGAVQGSFEFPGENNTTEVPTHDAEFEEHKEEHITRMQIDQPKRIGEEPEEIWPTADTNNTDEVNPLDEDKPANDPPKKPKRSHKKKVPQTNEVPSGEITEEVDL
jgi:hypothetical protein